jgi:hypothetical protein
VNEERMAAYMDLIQQLLACAEGEESGILAAHTELMDQEFTVVLGLLAQHKSQEADDEAAQYTGRWLLSLQQQIRNALGIEETANDNSNMEQSDLEFLQALIQAEAEDSRLTQALFAQNIQRLTPNLGTAMSWLIDRVAADQPEALATCVGIIEGIVIELSNFPLGNRAQNLEIVIMGYPAIPNSKRL